MTQQSKQQLSFINIDLDTTIEQFKICFNQPEDDMMRFDRDKHKGLKHIEIKTPDITHHINNFGHKCDRDYYCLKPVCERLYMGVANPIKALEFH